jgi:hypothetical protein
MALRDIHQGEDYSETFSREVDGAITASANLSEIEVYLFIEDTEVARFSMTDKTNDGYTNLTSGPADGKFTFKVPSAKTENWRPGSILVGEFYFTLSSSDRRPFRKELGRIIKMHS